MDMSDQFHAPTALPPGKEPPVPIGWDSGWDPGSVLTRWWRKEIPAPVRKRKLVTQPAA